MNFQEAMEKAAHGEKVRCVDWSTGLYVYYEKEKHEKFWLRFPGDHEQEIYEVDLSDVFGVWEIVSERG